jgi:hypothetical protein
MLSTVGVLSELSQIVNFGPQQPAFARSAQNTPLKRAVEKSREDRKQMQPH